jgi:methionyl-tRNA formyltransferase
MSQQPNAKLKIIFAGTAEFAATILAALLTTSHEIIAVYTKPDRPAGRGRKITSCPVKILAEQAKLVIQQPTSLNSHYQQQQLIDTAATVMIVAAYGLIIPAAILPIPALGCINIHASLLPRWRGASPIQQAILAGDTETGISLMQMDAGLDTGAILTQASCTIAANDTSLSLEQRLASLAAKLLLDSLPLLSTGILKPIPQSTAGITYAAKLLKTDGKINWQETATVIERKIRAYYPWPVAFTTYHHAVVRIFAATAFPANNSVPPGTIVSLNRQGIDVATADGCLRITQLQFPGGKIIAVKDLLNAQDKIWQVGHCFI